MRQLTKRLTCSGFFSGLIITASSGLCQEQSLFPEIRNQTPVTKQIAWDQIPALKGPARQNPAPKHPALSAKPVSHATASPAPTTALIGPSDVFSALPRRPAVNKSEQPVDLPWDVVVAPNVPGHSKTDQAVQLPWDVAAAPKAPRHSQNEQPVVSSALLAEPTSGLIGPADFQPTPMDEYSAGLPVAQAPAVAAPPSSSKVSLLPMTAAKQPNVTAADTQAAGTRAAETQPVRPQPDASPSDRAAEPKTYVLQNVRPPEKATATHPETLIPIDILPFNRLVSSDMQASTDLKYSTAQMTGPLTDASMLFAQLHIDEDYRNVPAVALSPVRTLADPSGFGPEWMYRNYAWVSPTFYHKPLYFEQANLERYGIGPRRGLQPFYSAGHFYLSLGLMPYKMLTQHPCEHVYTLGHNRPGDCVPYQKRSLLGQSYPFEAFKYFHSSCYR